MKHIHGVLAKINMFFLGVQSKVKFLSISYFENCSRFRRAHKRRLKKIFFGGVEKGSAKLSLIWLQGCCLGVLKIGVVGSNQGNGLSLVR